jgi:flagellar motor switch protein FliM
MAKILSQEEIDALLSGPASPTPAAERKAAPIGVSRYNFRRPDRVSKDQIHSLQMLHDRFARNISTSLSAYFRTMTEVAVVSVEQFSYSEYLMALSDPTAFYALAVPPFDDLGALEISPSLAFAMVDRMLGGIGAAAPVNRALTEIEQHVVDSVVRLLLEALSETWRPVADMAFGIRGRETRPQMLQVAAPNETIVMVVFDMRIGESRGMLNLCLPAAVVETTSAHFAQSWNRPQREPTLIERLWLRDNLSRVPLPLSAELESTFTARDILTLQLGDVVSLGVAITDPLDIRVGTSLKFKGRLAADAGWTTVNIESPYDVSGVEA